MDEQHVLHRFLLWWSMVASKTNGGWENGHPVRTGASRFMPGAQRERPAGDGLGDRRFALHRVRPDRKGPDSQRFGEAAGSGLVGDWDTSDRPTACP